MILHQKKCPKKSYVIIACLQQFSIEKNAQKRVIDASKKLIPYSEKLDKIDSVSNVIVASLQ